MIPSTATHVCSCGHHYLTHKNDVVVQPCRFPGCVCTTYETRSNT